MPVVTIARQLGSGGEEIAALVGRHLSARVLDGELLALASARSGVPLGFLADFDERGRSMLHRPGDLVRLVPLPPINPDAPDVTGDRYPPTGPVLARGEGLVSPAYWGMEAYATLLARTMQAEAADGDVVIVGRAGNEAIRQQPSALHVLVVGSRRRCIQRLMAAEGLDGYDALERVQISDRDRAAYARQFYGADWLDPHRYDLVVNTDGLSFETAADLISRATSAAGSMPPSPEVAPALAGT
ncbi:MAG: AAA family ATPase [Chloroflexota bacterium]